MVVQAVNPTILVTLRRQKWINLWVQGYSDLKKWFPGQPELQEKSCLKNEKEEVEEKKNKDEEVILPSI